MVAVNSFLAYKFKVGNSIVPASSVTKAALEALIKYYAAQYASQQLTTNVIVPGYIKKHSPDHQALPDESMQRLHHQKATKVLAMTAIKIIKVLSNQGSV